MDFKILAVVFLAVYVAQINGMPADPIFRISGMQSDNPYVKVFSTYPTEKPNSLKDNPNELEKGLEEEKKFLKKSKTKAESDVTGNQEVEIAPESTSLLENAEIEESAQENGSENIDIPSEEPETTNENVQLSNDEEGTSKSFTAEDSQAEPTTVATQTEEIEIHEEQPEMLEPIEDDMMALPSQLEDIRPIGIEAPLQFLPPIVEREDVGKFIFDNLGNVEILDEPSHSFNVKPASPVLMPAGVVEETKEIDTASAVVEDPLGKKTMVNPTPLDAVEPMKTVAETADERMEPMASLTGTNMPIEPIAEMEPEITETTAGTDTTESVTEEIVTEVVTEEPLIDDMGELGEIGATMSESETDLIAPIVEAEPASVFTAGEVEEITPIQEAGAVKERVSLKIIKSEDEELEPEVPENNEFFQLIETIQTEEPVPMAGFMSDASKSAAHKTEEVTKDEKMIPSTTELTYVINIEEETTQAPESADAQEIIENDAGASVSNAENISELGNLSTTTQVPIVDPIELALQEEQVSGNDPSINETI